MAPLSVPIAVRLGVLLLVRVNNGHYCRGEGRKECTVGNVCRDVDGGAMVA